MPAAVAVTAIGRNCAIWLVPPTGKNGEVTNDIAHPFWRHSSVRSPSVQCASDVPFPATGAISRLVSSAVWIEVTSVIRKSFCAMLFAATMKQCSQFWSATETKSEPFRKTKKFQLRNPSMSSPFSCSYIKYITPSSSFQSKEAN